jgi:hypothetical protein
MTMPTWEELKILRNKLDSTFVPCSRVENLIGESSDMLRRIADALKDSVVVPKSRRDFVLDVLEHYPLDAEGMFQHLSESRLYTAVDGAMLAAANKENGND